MSDLSDDSDEDVYEVEKITNHVVCDGETYYCVTWKGYEGPEAQTWEPKENLLSCEDLLNAYIAGVKDGSKTSTSLITSVKHDSSDNSSDDDNVAALQQLQSHQNSYHTDGPTKRGRGRGRGRGSGRGRGKAKPPTNRRRREPVAPASSSSSDGSSSDEVPHVKDPFWDNLEKGRINVFNEDLYSKVKRRRGPATEELVSETTVLPAITKKKRTKKKPSVDKDEQLQAEPVDKNNEKPAPLKSPIDVSSDDASNASLSSPVLKYLDDQLNEKAKSKRGKKLNNKKPEKLFETNPTETNSPAFTRTTPEVENMDPIATPLPSGSKEMEKDSIIFDVDNNKNLPEETESTIVSSTEKYTTDLNILESDDVSSLPTIEKRNVSERKSSLLDEVRTSENTLQKVDDEIITKKEPTKKKKAAKKNADKTRSPLPATKSGSASQKDKTDSSKEISKIESSKEKGKIESSKEKGKPENSKDKNINKTPAKDNQTKEPAKLPVKLSFSDELIRGSTVDKPKSKDRPSLSSTPDKSSQMPEKRTKPKLTASNASKSASKSQNYSASTAPSHPSTSRSDESYSVFEAMQKELRASNFPDSTTRASPEDKESEDRISDEVVNDNVDMSEYLKVKVNFSLDKVTVKEIEHHHETGEPPCRLGREVSNAEFRQFIRSNNYEMVFEVLKSKGRMYNLEHQDAMWMTQLMIASAAGYSEIVKVLAHHGARVNARTKSNQTALMFAAEKGHDLTVRTLLMYGAYVNLQTSSGETALMKAAKGGHLSIVHSLLQAGADPCTKSPHGVSALNMEGRTAASAVSLAKKHKQNVEQSVEACVRQTLSHIGVKALGSSLFGVKTYNIREHAFIYFTYHCLIKDLPPSQGIALFAVHGSISTGLSVKCRMRGPCHLNAVTVNNLVMEPMMPSKENNNYSHFMTNVVWRTGQNSFRLFLAQDGLSREKLYLCAYVIAIA